MPAATSNRPRVAIASCREREQWVVADDPVLADAFEDAGADAIILDWDDPTTDWSSFDAVVIRSTWDYTHRLDEFTSWLEHVDRCTLLLNPLNTVFGLLDKLYLERLEASGVPTVPTRVVREVGREHVARAVASLGSDRVAVKPALGAGAIGLLITDASDIHAISAHTADLIATGPALIQPFLPAVAELGELSVVYIDGVFSHAVRKIPKAGDVRVQVEYGGIYTPEQPSPKALAVADAAVRAWPGDALYARIDLLEAEPGRYLVIECELVEPELFFRMLPETADRFARATLKRITSGGDNSITTPRSRAHP